MTSRDDPFRPGSLDPTPAPVLPAAGFSVVDGVALVMGAAVAAVHVRELVELRLRGPGWAILWIAFFGVAVTAAGPFVLLARRWLRGIRAPFRLGEGLWLVQGIPWIAAAALRGERPLTPAGEGMTTTADLVLWIGVLMASGTAMGLLWSRWIVTRAVEPPEASLPWTQRVGLVLAVAWPLQVGFALVVTG
jgi:hypothetical protein